MASRRFKEIADHPQVLNFVVFKNNHHLYPSSLFSTLDPNYFITSRDTWHFLREEVKKRYHPSSDGAYQIRENWNLRNLLKNLSGKYETLEHLKDACQILGQSNVLNETFKTEGLKAFQKVSLKEIKEAQSRLPEIVKTYKEDASFMILWAKSSFKGIELLKEFLSGSKSEDELVKTIFKLINLNLDQMKVLKPIFESDKWSFFHEDIPYCSRNIPFDSLKLVAELFKKDECKCFYNLRNTLTALCDIAPEKRNLVKERMTLVLESEDDYYFGTLQHYIEIIQEMDFQKLQKLSQHLDSKMRFLSCYTFLKAFENLNDDEIDHIVSLMEDIKGYWRGHIAKTLAPMEKEKRELIMRLLTPYVERSYFSDISSELSKLSPKTLKRLVSNPRVNHMAAWKFLEDLKKIRKGKIPLWFKEETEES